MGCDGQGRLQIFTVCNLNLHEIDTSEKQNHCQTRRHSPTSFFTKNSSMKSLENPLVIPVSHDADAVVPALIGQLYESAPPSLKAKMLEQLLKPLGVLALVAIGNGIFAKIRFRSGWPDVQVRLEDAAGVQPSDVVALAERVQQVSLDVLDGLARVVSSSPVLASSAAAAMLLAVIMAHNKRRRDSD